MRRPDLTQLAVGLAIVLLGVLLLLQEEGSIDLDGGWLAAGLTACAGVALLASGLGARDA
jgi:presenilin-like A22 family membrane protease